MRIVLSPHAKVRSKERQISLDEIKDTIENYEIRTPTTHRRRTRVMKKINGRMITVIYEQKDGYSLVVTCAKPEKEGD